MKFCYSIPTRGRPLNLLGTINTAWRLRSGKHEIRFAVEVDADDMTFRDASGALDEMNDVVDIGVDPRPDALGVKWNRGINPNQPPDAALLMTDRMIPITPGWDDVVAQCVTRYPDRILWWRSSDPGTVAPVVPRSWLQAMDWKPAVELFPAWWIDTHLMELDRFIHGEPSLMMPCFYAGERRETQQLRDVAFWCRYYAALRPQRVEQAKLIAASLGRFWTDRPELLAEFGAQDAMRLKRAAEFERVFGDTSEPWDGYRRIKAQAEAFMAEREAA